MIKIKVKNIVKVFVLFGFITGLVTAGENQNYEKVLQMIAQKKATIINQMENLNSAKESLDLNQKLEEFWVSDSVKNDFKNYYNDVEARVNNVKLRKKYSNIDAMLAQYKALYDDAYLREISNTFVDDSMEEIQIIQEEFIDTMYAKFADYSNKVFLEEQYQIANNFDEILRDKFKYVPKSFIELAAKTVESTDFDENITISTNAGKVGMAGAAIVLMSKRIQKTIIKTVGKKVVGKVAAKFIPWVGWALLAYDVYDTSNAKEKMTDQLRELFIDGYKSTMTSSYIWSQSRLEIENKYKTKLATWMDKQKLIIKNLLEAAVLMENPTFKEYAQKRINADGASIGVVVSEINDLQNTFGPLALNLSIESMYHMKANTPLSAGKSFLPGMVDAYGSDLEKYYKKYGKRLFDISNMLGIQQTKKLIYANKDIITVYALYSNYLGSDASSEAQKGFFSAMNMNMNLDNNWNEALFISLNQYKELVHKLLQSNVNEEKIKKILSHSNVLPVYQNLYEKDTILASAISKNMSPLQIYSRFHKPEQINNIFHLFQHFNKDKKELDADIFIDKIKNNPKLVSIYTEYGMDGLSIYKTYVDDNSGKLQLEYAEKALALYEKGYDKNKLKDSNYVNNAYSLMDIPGGKGILDLFYPIIKQLGLIGTLISILIILFLVVLIIKILFGIKRNKNEKRTTNKIDPIKVEIDNTKKIDYEIKKDD